MQLATIEKRIADHADSFRACGVESLDVFGSVARGEARADSDLDFIVELGQPAGLFALHDVRQLLERLFPAQEIHLSLKRALRAELRDTILNEAVPCLPKKTGVSA